MLVCLKCGTRVSDDEMVDPCPGTDTECGAREWAWVREMPPFELTINDRRFLRRLVIAPD